MRSKRPSFWGDLLSAQVGAAQQGKTENLVFNRRYLHDLTLQVQFPRCSNTLIKASPNAKTKANATLTNINVARTIK
jgi:hypothetical protein